MTTAWNEVYFAPDVPVLTMPWTDTDRLVITISDNMGATVATISENYAADASGNIHVSGIGDLAMAYLEPYPLDELPVSGSVFSPWVTVTVSVTHADESVTAHTTKVYYATSRTEGTRQENYAGFFSRYTRKIITPDAPVVFSTPAANTVRLSVTYRSGMMRHTELTLSAEGQAGIAVYYLPLSVIAQLVAAQTGTAVVAADIYECRAMIIAGGAVVDSIVFTVDSFHFRNATCFVFTNNYGCPEAEVFTGADTMDVEMDSEQAYMNGRFRKSWTRLTDTNTVHSGHLTSERFSSVRDLAQSPRVLLTGKDGSSREVTVTKIGLASTSPLTAPRSAELTYRIADIIQEIHTRRRVQLTRVFDISFDHSFE